MITRTDVRDILNTIHYERTRPTRRHNDPGQMMDVVGPGWRDMLASLTDAKTGGLKVPDWAEIGSTGFYAYHFGAEAVEGNEELIFTDFHIPHDIAVDENGRNAFPLYLHVHWLPEDNSEGVVRWEFATVYADGHSRGAFDFTDPTIVTVEQEAGTTAFAHHISETTEGDSIAAGVVEVDGLICLRIKRKSSHANDTYAGSAIGLFADLHYYADRMSTPNKAPNFYTESWE